MILKIDSVEVTGTVEECLEFLKKYYDELYVKPFTITTPDITPVHPFPNQPFITWQDDCKDCIYYEQWKKPGFTYVGDSPCDLCWKRKPYCVYTGDSCTTSGSSKPFKLESPTADQIDKAEKKLEDSRKVFKDGK